MTDFNLPFAQVLNRTVGYTENRESADGSTFIVAVLAVTIASIGILSNATVVVVFLNQAKLRRKVPIIYIINQVYYLLLQRICLSQLAKKIDNDCFSKFHYTARNMNVL